MAKVKKIISEELRKFRLLSEYDFYDDKNSDLEYEELDEDDELDVSGEVDSISTELGIDDESDDMGNEPPTDDIGGQPQDSTAQQPEPAPVAPAAPPVDDSIELDVTDLVKGSDEVKQTADMTNRNTEILLKKFNDLESRLSNMAVLTKKIDNLEKEFVKRNPTSVEKLEMRSLDSFPYSQKLSDYWLTKDGQYDVGNKSEEVDKEYVLTQDDVDSTYSDSSIKQSFDYDEEEF